MKQPQVINLNSDKVIAIDGNDVIYDSGVNIQKPIGLTGPTASIAIQIAWWDLTSNSSLLTASSTMSYQSAADIWTIDLTTITVLNDRHKYIGNVTCTDSSLMRALKLSEFSVDNDGFEDTWMRLPYQVEIGTPSYIKWYDTVAHFGNPTYCQYYALAYQNGTGTTAATDPSKVTHRGPIVAP